MRKLMTACCIMLAAGCGGPVAKFDGPKVNEFTGHVVAGGNAVKFPDGEKVTLKLIHEKGQSFGVPVNADGSYKVGWMPIGSYSANVIREKPHAANARGQAPSQYAVPGGFKIEEGKIEYTVELGRNFKP